MRILGISAYYHDAAAALVDDGRVVAAAQEERFSRVKHDPGFPLEASRDCLDRAGLRADELDAVAYYEKPFLKFDRILSECWATAPRGFGRFARAIPLWLTRRLWVKSDIEHRLETLAPVYFLQHHESHAASAFGPSPFQAAAVLTLDGVGEWATNALWRAEQSRLEPLAEIRYPNSLGLLYSAFTAYCGFEVNDGEYKLMGLAPYGEPRYVDAILEHLIDLRPDGSYRLNPEFFAFRYREQMTSSAFHRLFGGPPRGRGSSVGRRQADLARSVQAVVEETLLRQARFARRETRLSNLCLAGGVALNCVANGRLARERIFDRLWIQPAAGDAGGALGAAWALWLRLAQPTRVDSARDHQAASLLGPEFSEARMERALVEAGRPFVRLTPEALVDEVAAALASGETVGWFQGRMEFGPRALGNRSILADPRDDRMQSRVNRAIKFRESFRPFAPVVAEEAAATWFDLPSASPYMLLTGQVRGARPTPEPAVTLESGEGPRVQSPLPAITHVDGSARVQTLARADNPFFHALLTRFGERTGCPVLLNTSFNVKDEPIVCSPEDAIACFGKTGLDWLVLGPFLTRRGPVPPQAARRVPGRGNGKQSVLEAAAAAVAFLALWWLGHAPRAAIFALGLGLTLAAMRLWWPRGRQGVDLALSIGGKVVARLLALPPLALVFAFVIVPGRLVGRRRRRQAGVAPGASLWSAPAEPTHDPSVPY